MEASSEKESIQEAVSRLDALAGPAVLFDREERIIHANEKARAFFNRPLVMRHDLPERLTVGLEGVLTKGTQSYFCYQEATGGPNWRIRLQPEYLDTTQPEHPTCALLMIEKEPDRGSLPRSIAVHLFFEFANGGCVPMSAVRQLAESKQGDPEFLATQKQAVELMFVWTTRVGKILQLVAVASGMVDSCPNERLSLASLMAEADQDAFDFFQLERTHDQARQLVCNGPDNLAFATLSRNQFRFLFSEIFRGIRPRSVSAQWAEDNKRLGVPAGRIEFTCEFGFAACLWLLVVTEIVLNGHGCLELTAGKPGTLCLWLPLAPPQGF